MADRNYEFLRETLAKTRDQRLRWETTADEDVFAVPVGVKYVLVLSKGEGSRSWQHFLSLRDEEGRDVHTVKSADGPTIQETLGELYELARRQALRSDEKLDDVLAALKGL